MRLNLSQKIVGTLFIAVVSCCAIALLIAVYFMKKPIDDMLNEHIHKLQTIIQEANELTSSRFAQSATLASHDGALAKAIMDKNHDEVMRLSKNVMNDSGSDFMTVTDDKGDVVGRGHSPKWQDSVLNQETVVQALKGEPAVGIVSGTVVPLTIRASQPVTHEGKVVGTLSIGASLVTPNYLDWLKKMSGMEVTIFKGNTRVMSTLMKDGKRITGTQLNSPEIEDAVLNRGEVFFTQNFIDGKHYESAYWPMRMADGKIVGMWFVGIPRDNLEKSEGKALLNSAICTFGLVLVMLIIFVLLGMKISAPVRKITAYVMGISHGDKNISLDVHSNDDMGDLANALRGMVAKQDELIEENREKAEAANKKAVEAEQLSQQANAAHEEAVLARQKGMAAAAEQLETVASNLNTSIDEITERVEQSDHALGEVASNLSATSTAMEQMNATVSEVAKNVSVAANISASARAKASDGANIVFKSISGITEVHTQSMSLKKDMEQLSEHARSISNIMNVISDIADQTNLLALNAAIEAARAGEAGRGFAVVADEVRKLAEKTMTSTTEVGNAIEAIQHSVEHSGHQVDRAVENIAQATAASNKSGELLQEILAMVEQTADEIRAIATASEEQAASSDEITRSIQAINDLTTTTSGAMRTAAHGLEDLRHRSHDLVKLVDELKKG